MITQNNQTISQMQVTRLPLGAYDFVIHYAETLNQDTAEFRHSHSYMELFYIRSGELTIRFDEGDVSLQSGDLLLVPAHIPHHVLNIPGETKGYFVMVFEFKPVKSQHSRQTSDFHEVHEIGALLNQLSKSRYTLCPASPDAGVLLDHIEEELYEKKFGWSTFTNMLYYGFFLYAIRHIAYVKAENQKEDGFNLAIETTKYIHAHYAENISLETLAAHLYISPRHANRMFQKMFNTTFGKTLRALRLTYAKTLLMTTDLPAEKIAEGVGLSSAQALRKIFKKTEGITITQYRMQKNIKSRSRNL